MMQEMGNSRARAVYEANVPDSFRRPQSNAAVEAFIRSKYEERKYIAREWVPPRPVIHKEWLEDDTAERKKARSKSTSSASASTFTTASTRSMQSRIESTKPKASTIEAAATAARPAELKPAPQPQPVKVSSASEDLLGQDTEVVSVSAAGREDDLLSDIFGGPSSSSMEKRSSREMSDPFAPQQNGSVDPNFFEVGNREGGIEKEEKKSMKDSIMALYGSSGVQPQMFGIPGVVALSARCDGHGWPSAVWTNNPFQYPEGSVYQTYYVVYRHGYFASAGGVYVPQQQMMGGGGMVPIVQQQQIMMGMQPVMMGQPVPQSMMGMPQAAVTAYSMNSSMSFGTGQQGIRMLRGGGAAEMVMMGGGGGYMQPLYSQPSMTQHINPMQQHMQFHQMQQHMAGMSLGGSQMTGIQPPPPQQQMHVGLEARMSWRGGLSTGHTLSSSLWQ